MAAGHKNSEPAFKSSKGKAEPRAGRVREEPWPSLQATPLCELTGV